MDIIRNFRPLIINFDDFNYILLPVNSHGNHWLLAVLDLKHHDIYILDPGYSSQDQFICQKLNNFFQQRNDLTEWTLQPSLPFLPKQQDSHNCGVYVLFYIYIFSRFRKISTVANYFENTSSFDPEQFRKSLQYVILMASEDVSEICQVCGIDREGSFIKCDNCRRWVHFDMCARSTGLLTNVISFEEASNKHFRFNCNLCQIHQNPFESSSQLKKIVMDDPELRQFIRPYKSNFLRVINSRETNEEGRRFRETDNCCKHLKWDYTTAFISLSMSVVFWRKN